MRVEQTNVVTVTRAAAPVAGVILAAGALALVVLAPMAVAFVLLAAVLVATGVGVVAIERTERASRLQEAKQSPAFQRASRGELTTAELSVLREALYAHPQAVEMIRTRERAA